jgi:nucleoside-diphosphate-sugar epimerase
LLRIEPGLRGESVGVGSFFSSSTLLIDIPPEISLGTDYHPAQLEVIFDLLRDAEARPEQLVYISSTSVYGANQGVVDELVNPHPDTDSGSTLVHAEQMLSEFAREMNMGLTIVRPGGLIGPGRHPGLFLNGRRDVQNPNGVVNMIHQLDLADLLATLIAKHPVAANSCEIFNAVSAHHPTREEFYVRAANAIGVQAPTFAKPTTVGAGKVVRAEKIVRVTQCKPRFDDLYSAIGAT